MKVITLCGSLKFQDKMMEVAQKLALEGYCVLTPVYPVMKNEKKTDIQKERLKLAHFKRIEMSDEILVINVDNYIGDSTKLEIEYAKRLNKKIKYLYNGIEEILIDKN